MKRNSVVPRAIQNKIDVGIARKGKNVPNVDFSEYSSSKCLISAPSGSYFFSTTPLFSPPHTTQMDTRID